MSDSPLRQLSDRLGILPDYYDIWGNHHETTDRTRQAILGAMGIPAEDETDAATALRAWHDRLWHQALPPVLVVRSGEAARVRLNLPEHALARPHGWRLLPEHGETREDTFQPEALERLDQAQPNGETMVALNLVLPGLDELGYHRLELLRGDDLLGEMPLIVCPDRCYQPPAASPGKRVWGLSVQLPGLRSKTNWGMGDYGDLARVMDWAKQAGAALVGVNPLHALFPHNPRHCSPYSPSSRQFFNVLPIDVGQVPELAECVEAGTLLGSAEFQARLVRMRDLPLTDYAEVGRAKFEVLDILYRHFRTTHLAVDTERGRAFRAYQRAGGEDLRLFALYHALQSHFHHRDEALWGWPVWPEAYRNPLSPEVRSFAEDHVEAVEWQQWLQWLAEGQLAAVGRHAFDLGLGIGLYLDLAVGVDKGGAEAWMHQELYALEARVGCPPDDFNPMGQDWGLPPWVPQRLRQSAYAPFIALLRANMKYAGALRIDHVMGMMRLYWVPPGLQGDQGAYVMYPFGDLLGILALESQRNRCLIVGEDLGTVPDEVRHALHALGVLSYRLFYFEREDGNRFKHPDHYPEQALVAASTHDLPTLAGYWKGMDIELRTRLGLYPSEALREGQIRERAEDRINLLQTLRHEGLLPEGIDTDPDRIPELPPALCQAIQRRLARSQARIALVQAEDMLGETEQANMPGTVDEHPNWRRKLTLPLEAWDAEPRVAGMIEAMNMERGGA